MLRLRIFINKFSRSFSVFEPQYIKDKAIIDMKFSSSNLDSFLRDTDVVKTSLPMLPYILKITKDHPQELQKESWSKLFEIWDEVTRNLDKLESHSIANFSEWIAKGDLWEMEGYLSQEKRKILISRIIQLIKSCSFDRKQILLIHENLTPQGFKIEELENEVDKILDTPLTLKEISQIMTGCGRFIYTSKASRLVKCMEKIFMFNKEKLDVKYLAKILDALTYETHGSLSSYLSDYISRFLQFIEETIPRWKENDLISIFRFTKVDHGFLFYMDTYFKAQNRIKDLLENDQPIELAIKLVSLFKKDIKLNPVYDEIVSKSFKIIKEKLPRAQINDKNLEKIIDFVKPTVDYQFALQLADQINSREDGNSKIFQKVSWISVNKEGKLFPMIDLISKKIKLRKYMNYRYKIDTLADIIQTKNYEFYGLQKIKEILITDLRRWLTLNIDNLKHFFIVFKDREYSSLVFKELKPLVNSIFSSLKWLLAEDYCLTYSMMFYESDPEKWQEFLIENKNSFSTKAILQAIRLHKGSFEAIIFLLQTYKSKLSTTWINAVLRRIFEVKNLKIINDYAQILSKMDPHYLLNDHNIYTQLEGFIYLIKNSENSSVKELIVRACGLIKDLPLINIFNNSNIKILRFAAEIGYLESELADLVMHNYGYIREYDMWSIVAISSKCTDLKLRETIIKHIFNENLDLEKLCSLFDRYWLHPETKEIDSYIIDFLKKKIPSLGLDGIWIMTLTIKNLSKVNTNKHFELYDTIVTLLKNLIISNIWKLNFTYLNRLLSLAEKKMPIDFDFAYIIWKSQIKEKSYINEGPREDLIEKINTVGLSDRKAVLAVCNKRNNLGSAYLSKTISCLADLRFEKEKWANQMANKLIDYAEEKHITFKSNIEYINWIYGLIIFKANKSVIMRNLENIKYFECELPTFKHFLLENHFKMDPDYKGIRFLEQNTLQYLYDFDYFKHFGIDAPLISLIKSSLNKENLEVKAGTFLDGVWIPFYIPSKKAALWPVTNSLLLYRSNVVRGEFAMHRIQMLQKLKDLIILDEDQTNKIEVGGIRQFFNI